MRYLHIEDGRIDEGPKALPRAWRNVSGLDRADAARLKELGWLPEVRVGFKPFDPATQVRTGPVHQVGADDVTATYTVRAKTQGEMDADQRAADLGTLREAGRDLAVVLVELVDWLLANTAMTANDFTPAVRQTYVDVKAITERVKT